METPQHTIRIHPLKTALSLCVVSLIIIIFSLLGQRAHETGDPTEKFFRELFTTEFFVNNGENIATYWNMLILTGAAVLVFVIASVKQMQRDKFRYGWWALGMIFSYFAVDTLAGVTERLATLLKDLPTMEGGFLYNWFYPLATVIIVLVLLFFVWFYLHLNAPNRFLFPISIILYIFGAYKAELLSAYYGALYGTNNTGFLFLTHAEELAEYLGVILMIYLLLTYFATHIPEMEFTA
jgi:hypothetical protein